MTLRPVMTAKAVRAVVMGALEVMGPMPPEVTFVREKLGGYEQAKEHVRYVSDEQINAWLDEAGITR